MPVDTCDTGIRIDQWRSQEQGFLDSRRAPIATFGRMQACLTATLYLWGQCSGQLQFRRKVYHNEIMYNDNLSSQGSPEPEPTRRRIGPASQSEQAYENIRWPSERAQDVDQA